MCKFNTFFSENRILTEFIFIFLINFKIILLCLQNKTNKENTNEKETIFCGYYSCGNDHNI